jgi:hypothetical protein
MHINTIIQDLGSDEAGLLDNYGDEHIGLRTQGGEWFGAEGQIHVVRKEQ